MKQRKPIQTILFWCSLLTPIACLAEEVGREVKWNTLGANNHVDVELVPPSQTTNVDTEQSYTLPAAPVNDDTGDLAAMTSAYIKTIELQGCTVFTATDLSALVSQYTNREVTMAELSDLRLALSRMYVDAGYFNSGVIIPDQKIVDGHIVFSAIEGKLAGIEVTGDPQLADLYIRGRLSKQIATPLNVHNLKDVLQNIQRDRNINAVDVKLAPGDVLGEGVMRIAVQEPKRFEIALSADNHHSSSAGAERGRLSLESRNITGLGEVLRIAGGITEGTDEQTASFEIPLTRFDTKLQLYYSESESDIIEAAFEALDISSETQTKGVTLTQPIIDNLVNTVSLTLGYEEKSSATSLLGESFSFSPGAQQGLANTNVALYGVDWINRGETHVAALRGTLRRGLDQGDATIFEPLTELDRLSNPTGADGEFTSFITQGLYIKRLNSFSFLPKLNDRAQLIMRGVAQISMDPLMSLEKLAIGGANTVRGYPENLLVRDNGVAGTVEFQLPITGYTGRPGWKNLVFAQFIDFGLSWDKEDVDLASSLRDTDETRYIVGAGLGLTWEPIAGLKAQVFWAYDTADNFSGDDPRDSKSRDDNLQDQGVHFSVIYARRF